MITFCVNRIILYFHKLCVLLCFTKWLASPQHGGSSRDLSIQYFYLVCGCWSIFHWYKLVNIVEVAFTVPQEQLEVLVRLVITKTDDLREYSFYFLHFLSIMLRCKNKRWLTQSASLKWPSSVVVLLRKNICSCILQYSITEMSWPYVFDQSKSKLYSDCPESSAKWFYMLFSPALASSSSRCRSTLTSLTLALNPSFWVDLQALASSAPSITPATWHGPLHSSLRQVNMSRLLMVELSSLWQAAAVAYAQTKQISLYSTSLHLVGCYLELRVKH